MSRLRTIATTMAAAIVAVVNMATRRSEPSIDLRPGDRAPDFTLPASDGRTYRLGEYAGRRAVVVAWFPKAFTGG